MEAVEVGEVVRFRGRGEAEYDLFKQGVGRSAQVEEGAPMIRYALIQQLPCRLIFGHIITVIAPLDYLEIEAVVCGNVSKEPLLLQQSTKTSQ